jgi:putative hydrolase of the HAD superfamily
MPAQVQRIDGWQSEAMAESRPTTPNTALSRRFEALLLDIGDVISAPVWEQFDELEEHLGRRIAGRGPLEPDGDAAWQRFQRGECSYYDYWREFATLNGYEDWRALFRDLALHLPHRFVDPDAYALMDEARTAGLKVGVLTNDGVGIAGHDFFASLPEFQELDAFVDAREFGWAKPEPEPYLRAADTLGTAPERIVFLDDTQVCVEGAERVGMTGVLVDPIDKGPAFARTRQLLGLSP